MKVTIKGQSYEAHVDDRGQFSADIGGQVYHADTLAGLEKAARAGVRRTAAKVAVPFSRQTPGSLLGVRHGVATGIHERNRTILVRWDDNGQADQLDRWNRGALGRLTDAEAELYARLLAARRDADQAVDSFEAAHRIDLEASVREAIDAAVAKAGDE